MRIFFQSFLQIGLVSISTILITKQLYFGIFIVGSLISFLWTFNVSRIAVSTMKQKIIYYHHLNGMKNLKRNNMKEYIKEAKKRYGDSIYDIEQVDAFIEGVKWRQEQNKNKYSEEEVLEHLNHLIMMPSSKLDEFTNDEEMVTMKWFEQFKQQEL